jgi:DNA-binding transcriptional ArsR family regulator
MPGKTARRGKPPLPPLRAVSDARTLRALTHPVRIALLEALTLHGPLTATGAGEQIGESATTCSFHLRQLARFGLVEEAGGGKGRARPWRVTTIGMSLSGNGDAETEVALGALTRMWRERLLDRYQGWLESRALYPKRWREAVSESEYVFYLTVEELEELNVQLTNLLLPRSRERLADPAKRPAGAIPVEVLLFTFPVALPPGD